MDFLLSPTEITFEKSKEHLLQSGFAYLYGQPLFEKLAEIYQKEVSSSEKIPGKFHCGHTMEKFLGKLVKRDKMNCLVLNLYRNNEGYSLSIKMSSGIETETIRLPYEDETILSYIDQEELPPMLLDLLDEANVEIFYSGCIIVEIRDYRRSTIPTYECKHILLKPTNQSILADVAMLSKGKNWSIAEKLQLESKIVNQLNTKLDLSPSPVVGLMKNKAHCMKYKYSSVPLRRAARRFSQVARNRAKNFEDAKPAESLRLLAFLKSKGNKKTPAHSQLKQEKTETTDDADSNLVDNIDLMKQQQEMQSFYAKIAKEVSEVAHPIKRREECSDNNYAFIEEYTLETERSQGRIYLTKLMIHQRLTDEVYFGELYVDRDYQDGEERGSSCRFPLGTLHQVRRYIQQFKEILTEEGRKSVKILHRTADMAEKVVISNRKDVDVLKQHVLDHNPNVDQTSMGAIRHPKLAQQLTSTQHLTKGTAPMQQVQQSPQPIQQADGTLKKSLTVVAASNGSSGSNLSTLISSHGTQQQQQGHQQMVVGRNVNLANLIGGRQVNTQSSTTVPSVVGSSQNAHQLGAKVTVNVQAGSNANKLALPMLAAQLNRPAPSYSQAINASKPQQISSTTDPMPRMEPKTQETPPARQPNSNLQALLAGTPSADNPGPHSKGSALLERLSAQSVGLNSMKASKHHQFTHQEENSSNVNPRVSPMSSQSSINNSAQSSNINLANITNIPGLNVGIPNLQPLQNVQVSIPGLSTPISFTINNVAGSSNAVIVTSSSQVLPNQITTKSTSSPVVSSPTTVMIASQPGLPQGQVVQLPLGQLGTSHLATQLTKAANTGNSSTIPVLQIQSSGGSGNLFTSLRGTSSSPSQASHSQSPTAPDSKQPVQIAMSKQPSVLAWQLQQKLKAAKRQQHQQSQQHQQPPQK